MTASLADKPARYQVRVHGRLAPLWGGHLSGLTVTLDPGGEGTAVTDLSGWMTDQAALMGMLERLYGIGVTLLRVQRLDDDDTAKEKTRVQSRTTSDSCATGWATTRTPLPSSRRTGTPT
jgi:hypothetical protein